MTQHTAFKNTDTNACIAIFFVMQYEPYVKSNSGKGEYIMYVDTIRIPATFEFGLIKRERFGLGFSIPPGSAATLLVVEPDGLYLDGTFIGQWPFGTFASLLNDVVKEFPNVAALRSLL